MKTILKIAAITIALVLMLIADIPLLPVQLVPEAHAVLGVRRRTAVVAGATVHAADSAQMAQSQQQAAAAQQQAAASQQQATAAKQEATAAQQQAATAKQEAATAQQKAAAAEKEAAAAKQQAAAAVPAPPPAAAGALLPLGTVVAALPAGCVSTPVGGVDYFYCGGNFYRAAFQGNALVYVTTQPK
jgi:type II secretory pathway component GspD/PulD (secretin)